MPMDFPDMKSLENAAKIHSFRQPHEDEPEAAFRQALACHVAQIDFIEGCEIRFSVGWDKFTDEQNLEMLRLGRLTCSDSR